MPASTGIRGGGKDLYQGESLKSLPVFELKERLKIIGGQARSLGRGGLPPITYEGDCFKGMGAWLPIAGLPLQSFWTSGKPSKARRFAMYGEENPPRTAGGG